MSRDARLYRPIRIAVRLDKGGSPGGRRWIEGRREAGRNGSSRTAGGHPVPSGATTSSSPWPTAVASWSSGTWNRTNGSNSGHNQHRFFRGRRVWMGGPAGAEEVPEHRQDPPPRDRTPRPRGWVQMSYVELHAHTAFSFLDGASLPEELAAAAADQGHDALALTDHDGALGGDGARTGVQGPRRGDRSSARS